jgi:hypothetical protein
LIKSIIISSKVVVEVVKSFIKSSIELVNSRIETRVQYSIVVSKIQRSFVEVTAIYVSISPVPTNRRLLEDGSYRLLEDGSFRLLED